MVGKHMNDPSSQIDSIFLTQIQFVLDKYGCSIKNIDMENRILDLDCPDDMTEECTMEIVKMFEEFLV